MNTICYSGDTAVIGQSGHRSCDNWTDVRWKDYADFTKSAFLFGSSSLTHTQPTGPPVQDFEPGSTISQEHSVSPRAEG